MWHKYQPDPGWWACNIPDIRKYIETLRQQVAPEDLTPERLQQAIEEDTYGKIDLAECRVLLQEHQS